MNPKQNVTLSKDEILAQFAQLAEEKKDLDTRVATKEEQAARAKDRQAVESASQNTVETIVKGLADLQLSFGVKVDELIARLSEESSRLDELRKGIKIETTHAKYVNDVKIAAEAFHIQTLENKEAVRAFEEQANDKRQTLQDEIDNTRAKWQKERKQTEENRKAAEEQAKKDRAKAEADYIYELERKRKVETDAFGEKRRKLERELAETGLAKEKGWSEREKLLADKKAEHEANLARIAALPQELDEAVKKAREEAIKDAHGDARVKADLLEKEIEGNRKLYELQIKSHEEQSAKLQAQIESLTTQLQAANREVQELALRAIEGTAGNRQALAKALTQS